MLSFDPRFERRRRLLQWLSASPLLASPGFSFAGVDRPSKLPELEANAPLITSPSEAINVFDFEPVFFKNVPPAHIGYMASGIDAEATLKANREAFSKYYLRPRRLNDVSKVDMSVDVLGVKYPNPIFICPTGGNKAYHPEGEAAVARAAKTGGHLEMLATPATTSMEDAIAARGATKMKIVIKGILTAEDARLAVANGVDGLVVSNHGGRGEDSGRATIDVLPEVVDAVQGKILVLVDGGFRRGTDVAKALAMGANAVGVGRPYLWGLGAFGEAGVAKVLEILRTETRVAMMQCGVRTVKEFTPAFVRKV